MREDYMGTLEREAYISTIREELDELSDEILRDLPTDDEPPQNNEKD